MDGQPEYERLMIELNTSLKSINPTQLSQSESREVDVLKRTIRDLLEARPLSRFSCVSEFIGRVEESTPRLTAAVAATVFLTPGRTTESVVAEAFFTRGPDGKTSPIVIPETPAEETAAHQIQREEVPPPYTEKDLHPEYRRGRNILPPDYTPPNP